MDVCKFCNKFNNNSSSSLINSYDKILFESQNFVVTPTIGSLVDGWVLIISKNHLISVGQLSKLHYEELQFVVREVKRILQSNYNNVFVFEHGPFSASQTTGCGIDHLHLHVVPLKFDLFEEAQKLSSFNWTSATLSTTKSYYSSKKSYLYIEIPSGEGYIATDANIPSQFFRKVIATKLETPNDFDWKLNVGWENIQKTITMFSSDLEVA